MNLFQCSNGHYYDKDKYGDRCPHCNDANGRQEGEAQANINDVTEKWEENMDIESNGFNPGNGYGFNWEQEKGFQHTEAYNDTEYEKNMTWPPEDEFIQEDDSKTESIFGILGATVGENHINQPIQPVVGWLVCIEGVHSGEDFRICTGRNFIGRNPDQNVCLSGEKTVSRTKHAIIVYDPMQRIYLVQPGDSNQLFYLNDKVVLEAKLIKAYDVLTVGEAKLVFIPFCNANFCWKIKEEDGNKKLSACLMPNE